MCGSAVCKQVALPIGQVSPERGLVWRLIFCALVSLCEVAHEPGVMIQQRWRMHAEKHLQAEHSVVHV